MRNILKNIPSNIIVLRHGDLDGVGASILFYNGLLYMNYVTSQKFNVTEYVCNYENIDDTLSEALSELEKNDQTVIWLLDISPVNESLMNIAMNTERVFIIDHHITALEKFKKYRYTCDSMVNHVLIDTTRCATKIVYDLFKETDYPLPENSLEFSNIVNDHDLQLRKMELSRKYDAFYREFGDDYFFERTMEQYGTISKSSCGLSRTKNNMTELYYIGNIDVISDIELLTPDEEYLTEVIIDNKEKEIKFFMDNYKINIRKLASDNTRHVVIIDNIEILNDVSHALSKEQEASGVYLVDMIAHIDLSRNKASLRSVSDMNVAKYAQQYNGGGHVKASGFISLEGILDIINPGPKISNRQGE